MDAIKNITIFPKFKTKDRVFLQKKNLTKENDFFTHQQQLNELQNNQLSLIIISHIKQKIASYKQQDFAKGHYNPSIFITFDKLNNMLKQCNLICCYCFEPIFILYGTVCEKKQWTLDRINNNEGHNEGNVVISCLECNLKRRRTNQNAFLMTKQVIINKIV